MKAISMKAISMKAVFACLLLFGLLCLPALAAAKPPAFPGPPLPAAALRDTAGHRHRLADLQGHPVALFFFCGCGPCRDCARLWAQVQQTGDLGSAGSATVIVFAGSAEAARSFVLNTGMDLARTLLLLDPADSVSRKFHVLQCPRVFVVSGGHLAYTSPDAGEAAPRLSAPALVSRALTVYRRLSAGPLPLERTAP